MPALNEMVGPWLKHLEALSWKRPTTPDLRTAHLTGTALEYRLGFDLAPADQYPYPQVNPKLDDDRARRARAVLGWVANDEYREDLERVRKTHRSVASLDQSNADLQIAALHHCWRLAYLETLVRAAAKHRLVDWNCDALWQLVLNYDPPISADVTNALTTAWSNYLRHGRANFAAHELPAVPHPTFADRFAVGDLLLGDTLVEVKYCTRPDADNLMLALRQVLGCALAEPDGDGHISRVGVYHVREAHLAEWNLEPLVQAAGYPGPSVALRAAFSEAIAAERAAFRIAG
jgi:hypothetical protein